MKFKRGSTTDVSVELRLGSSSHWLPLSGINGLDLADELVDPLIDFLNKSVFVYFAADVMRPAQHILCEIDTFYERRLPGEVYNDWSKRCLRHVVIATHGHHDPKLIMRLIDIQIPRCGVWEELDPADSPLEGSPV